MTTRPTKSIYGPSLVEQLTNYVVIPDSIYYHGKIKWKQHRPDQKYPRINQSTQNRELLTRLIKLHTKDYLELPSIFGGDCEHWLQIQDFMYQCRRKGCQFKLVREKIALPSGPNIWRIWRVE